MNYVKEQILGGTNICLQNHALSERVSECCLTPTQQFFLTISWREQVNFK